MPRKQHNELQAGIFVVLAVALAMAVVLWLGAGDYFAARGQVVSFVVPQQEGSVGLTVGSDVTIGDGSVGRISEIIPQAGRCIYHAQLVRRDITVKADGLATIISSPLGMSKLVITSMGNSSKLADDSHAIRLKGGLDQAMADISITAENAKIISQSLREELDGAKDGAMLASIHKVMSDLKIAAGNVVKITGNVSSQTDLANAASMFAKMSRSVDDIGQITGDAKPKIDRLLTSAVNTAETIEGYSKKDLADILAKLRESNNEIFKMAANLAQASQQAKDVIVMNRENIGVLVDNMTQVSANLKTMARDVRRNPWRLFYQPTDKEVRQQDIYDAASAFAEGASQLDQTVAKLNGLIKANPDGIPGDDKMLKDVVRELKDTFSRFSKAEQALWNELQK
jgi:ABC-type transporter Mla subunit MlaD